MSRIGLFATGLVRRRPSEPRLRRANQGDDRGRDVFRISDAGEHAWLQQEYDSEDLSAGGLIGPETAGWFPVPDRGASFGGHMAR